MAHFLLQKMWVIDAHSFTQNFNIKLKENKAISQEKVQKVYWVD